MTSHSKPLDWYFKKVAPIAGSAFFLCAVASAQTNSVTGDADVYGTVISNTVIQSKNAGVANLFVGYALTDQIQIEHAISGTIVVSNAFGSLSIESDTDGGLFASNTTALAVIGGTELAIVGGQFEGGVYSSANSNAPPQTHGAYLSGVQTATITSAEFVGGTVEVLRYSDSLPPLPGETTGFGYESPISRGSDGMLAEYSHLILTATSMTGGDGGTADSTDMNAVASGGNGLTLIYSTAVVSNGTYSGGNGGSASVSDDDTIAIADGGHGIELIASAIEIHDGTFAGGAAGSATGGDTDGSPSNGSGLSASDGSTVAIYGGEFSSGGDGDYSVELIDSDLGIYGGSFADGLLSRTSGLGTNHVALMGGSASNLVFYNADGGVQQVTIGAFSNSGAFLQTGGILLLNNLANSNLQNIVINSGSMTLSNDFALASGGTFTLDSDDANAYFLGDLTLEGGAELELGLGWIQSAGDVAVSNGALLTATVEGTNRYGRIANADRLLFNTGAGISIDATESGLPSGFHTITLATATNGVFVDGSAATETNFTQSIDVEVDVIGRTTFVGVKIPDANTLALLLKTLALKEYWNASGPFATLADEFDSIGNTDMLTAIDLIDDADASAAAVQETYLTTLDNFHVAIQGLQAAVGLSSSRGTEFREKRLLPVGANGPDPRENDWSFWAKYYGQFLQHDAVGANSAYDGTMHGGAIGVDKSFGRLLLGFSGGMGKNTIDTDSGFESSATAAHASIYSTLGLGRAYLDAALAYGFNDVETSTADPFDLDGEYNAQLVGGHIGAGIGFDLPKIATVVTPEASVHYTHYQQDAYTETGDAAVPRAFDEFDADSLRTALGLNVAMQNTQALKTFGFKLEGRAHWLHETNPDPGDLSFQLEGGNGTDYAIAYPMLDENAVRLGIGCSFFNTAKRKPKNVMLRLDFDELIGENYNSHNLSAKVLYAF
ncbi:autotransporter domain-containing protein [Pontiella sp.]|uniref:autotransporter family protein n=1 Tax=Pontiella sp. TaxID=2837462 RepID=UPI003568B1E0